METQIEGDTGEAFLWLLTIIPLDVYPLIGISIFLLLLSALVSGSEVAFFSLTPAQLEKCEKEANGNQDKVLLLVSNPKLLLATILILNNLFNVGIVTISTYAMWIIAGKENELAVALLTVIVTVAIVFFGEILPKVFATQKNMAFARLMSGPLLLGQHFLRPLAWLLIKTGNIVEKRFKSRGYQASVEDLNAAVEMTTRHTTTEGEKDILKGIVNFGTKSVKQVMKARMDITALEDDINFHVLMDKINKCGFSRIPIFTDTIDHVKGILYIKDLLPYLDKDEHFHWQELVRTDTFFVPENKKIDELLRDFQARRVHIAVVVDEYGGTLGLITMEDIIEEIVGEINDEFDTDEIVYKKIDENRYTFEGKTSLTDFSRILNLDSEMFNEAKGESESLGGLLLELFHKLPAAGEQVAFQNLLFTAVSVDKKRIKTVRILIKQVSSVEKNI